jgi:ribokinase
LDVRRDVLELRNNSNLANQQVQGGDGVRQEIVVLGSLNVDFVVRCSRRPKQGETVHGQTFKMFSGGKGANQAVAASRAGGKVTMAGRVGDDIFSSLVLDSLSESGVGVNYVKKVAGEHTGSAFITVDESGDNSIIVVPGANGGVSKSLVDELVPALQSAKILLLQLEMPLDAVVYAAQKAHDAGCLVMLDPAPAAKLPSEIWDYLDIVVPNEHEASFLTGNRVDGLETAEIAAKNLVSMGAKVAVVKIGPKGVVVAENISTYYIPSFSVVQVDSTAAGDTFAGAFAVSITEGKNIVDASRFANAAAALSVTKMGAQSSMPWRRQIDEFLQASEEV